MDAQAESHRVEAILVALEERGVRAAPITEAIDLGRSHPGSVADLAIAVIRRFPQGGTFLDAALSYLPEGLWNGLVRFALETRERTGDNEATDSVIAHASLQALPALHPHLHRIFRLRPNAGTYYENWPWRESGTLDFEARLRVLGDPDETNDLREKAWKVMLETRHPRAVSQTLLALVDSVTPSVMGLTPAEAVEAYLNQVGLSRGSGRLARICPEALRHLVFPEPYFEDESRPPWLARLHPTWGLTPTPDLPKMGFGGHAGVTAHSAPDGCTD